MLDLEQKGKVEMSGIDLARYKARQKMYEQAKKVKLISFFINVFSSFVLVC